MTQLYNYKEKGWGEVEPGQMKRLEKSSLEVCTAESAPVSGHYWLDQGGMEAAGVIFNCCLCNRVV